MYNYRQIIINFILGPTSKKKNCSYVSDYLKLFGTRNWVVTFKLRNTDLRSLSTGPTVFTGFFFCLQYFFKRGIRKLMFFRHRFTRFEKYFKRLRGTQKRLHTLHTFKLFAESSTGWEGVYTSDNEMRRRHPGGLVSADTVFFAWSHRRQCRQPATTAANSRPTTITMLRSRANDRHEGGGGAQEKGNRYVLQNNRYL